MFRLLRHASGDVRIVSCYAVYEVDRLVGPDCIENKKTYQCSNVCVGNVAVTSNIINYIFDWLMPRPQRLFCIDYLDRCDRRRPGSLVTRDFNLDLTFSFHLQTKPLSIQYSLTLQRSGYGA